MSLDAQTPHPPDPIQTLYAGRFLHLRRAGTWEWAARARGPQTVAIVAITDADRLLIVEQFRTPVNASVIELPAGLVGDDAAGESLLAAAQRELWEETGYEARNWTLLGSGPSSAGLTDETAAIFSARQLRKTGPGAGDGHERITLHEVPIHSCNQFLKEQTAAGKLVDLKLYSSLWFAGLSTS